MANARKLQELNCSISVENESQLKSAIFEIQENREFYKKNVERIREYSSKFNGLARAVEVIEDVG
jgi:UDP:flavonoid glycosyltransferase YjiC (YdhE family)